MGVDNNSTFMARNITPTDTDRPVDCEERNVLLILIYNNSVAKNKREHGKHHHLTTINYSCWRKKCYLIIFHHNDQVQIAEQRPPPHFFISPLSELIALIQATCEVIEIDIQPQQHYIL